MTNRTAQATYIYIYIYISSCQFKSVLFQKQHLDIKQPAVISFNEVPSHNIALSSTSSLPTTSPVPFSPISPQPAASIPTTKTHFSAKRDNPQTAYAMDFDPDLQNAGTYLTRIKNELANPPAPRTTAPPALSKTLSPMTACLSLASIVPCLLSRLRGRVVVLPQRLQPRHHQRPMRPFTLVGMWLTSSCTFYFPLACYTLTRRRAIAPQVTWKRIQKIFLVAGLDPRQHFWRWVKNLTLKACGATGVLHAAEESRACVRCASGICKVCCSYNLWRNCLDCCCPFIICCQ